MQDVSYSLFDKEFYLCYIEFGGSMGKRDTLTNRQKEIMTFIKKFIVKYGYSPSVREIAHGVHLNSPATVHVHIQNLIDMNYLKRDISKHNSLILMVPNEFDFHDNECVEVPLIDKEFLEDFDHEIRHPDDTFYLSYQMIGNHDDVFLFKVSNDNLKNLGIFVDDLLIVSQGDAFSFRDVIVFQTDDFYIHVNTYSFVDSFFIKKHCNVVILGKVIGLYREY